MAGNARNETVADEVNPISASSILRDENSNWRLVSVSVIAGIPPYSNHSVQLKNSQVTDLLKSWIEVSRKVRTPRVWFLFH
jgi:hypothetical protein